MRLLAFGDSFVVGVGDPEHLGWITRLVVDRRNLTLYNLGVRRETSALIADRWLREAEPRLATDEPVRIVFSFGTNDCTLEAGAPRVATAQTLLHARSMLTAAVKLCPVLMVGPPPTADEGVAARTEVLNEHLKALCARLQIPFIDVFRPLAADGLWRREALAYDGAHPGAAGYQRMADLVGAHPAWRSFVAAD